MKGKHRDLGVSRQTRPPIKHRHAHRATDSDTYSKTYNAVTDVKCSNLTSSEGVSVKATLA
jgi:hypothetical protein